MYYYFFPQVSGSIDVLELLGKKTYHVISDHDPGLKKATHFLMDKGDKPNLSFILREAKEQSEIKAELDKEYEQARKAEFGAMFDEFQGMYFGRCMDVDLNLKLITLIREFILEQTLSFS